MFKKLVLRRRHERMLAAAALEAEQDGRFVEPEAGLSTSPTALTPPMLPVHHRSKSAEGYDKTHAKGMLAAQGVHVEPEAFNLEELDRVLRQRADSGISVSIDSNTSLPPPYLQLLEASPVADKETLNVWHNMLRDAVGPNRSDSYEDKTERPFLNLGDSEHPEGGEFITRSPAPTDLPIYETAYQDDVARIQREQGTGVTVYSNRRVDEANEGTKSSAWGKLKSVTG